MNVKEWNIDDSRSIYPQLKEIIKKRIIVGMYGKGESFPTVRELSQEACVNRNTMQRALSELEEEGLLITNRTVGRTVTTDENLIMQIRVQLAKEQVDMFIKEMDSLGYCAEEILSLVEETHCSRINIQKMGDCTSVKAEIKRRSKALQMFAYDGGDCTSVKAEIKRQSNGMSSDTRKTENILE